MSDKTKIEWANATWNPITGCTPISDGCTNCYAKRLVRQFPALHGYRGCTEIEPVPFDQIQFHSERLDQPLKWKKPRRIFVCSMSDLFHEDVDLEWVKKIYTVIMESWHRNLGHTFMVLTKRPERMAEIINPFEPLPNLWLGVTAENQRCADERIPILLDIPATIKFVSIEPMLEPVELFGTRYDYLSDLGRPCRPPVQKGIDWVILGAESGPGRRPCNIEWMIDVVNQCDAAGVPVFVKQVHDYRGRVVKDINDFPKALQRREFPKC